MKIIKNIVIISMAIFLLQSCATYYQKSYKFQNEFANGDIDKAMDFLSKNDKAAEKKDRLLYFFDRGVVEQMLGHYEKSNEFFEKAYIYQEDYLSNFSYDLIGMISNPMVKPYKAEDFESVLIHYYMALNYIQLGKLDEALVEVKRINIKLNELNDKYKEKKNRYKQDAFALNLMGIIYEAKGDINNAFIAYRNAYESYRDLYIDEFGVDVPNQLKKDLIRTAGHLGFRQELNDYEELFDMNYSPEREGGSLIVFWLNGLGPVKGEFSLNLSMVNGSNGFLTFANEAEGISIPYSDNGNSTSSSSQFKDLKFIRMAIPKYNVRKPYFNGANVIIQDSLIEIRKELDLGENIEKIAISTLQDRILREMATSVGRLAIKQASELALREKNEDLGTLLSIVNAATEKADTRNWQTLPNSIFYTRINLPEGNHEIQLNPKLSSKDTSSTIKIPTFIINGKTTFISYHSLESYPPNLPNN